MSDGRLFHSNLPFSVETGYFQHLKHLKVSTDPSVSAAFGATENWRAERKRGANGRMRGRKPATVAQTEPRSSSSPQRADHEGSTS